MKSLTIGTKFRAGFFALFAAMLILGITSIIAIHSLNDNFDAAAHKTARNLELFGDLNTLRSDLYLAERGVVLAAFGKDHEGLLDRKREFEATQAKLKAKFDEVAPLVSVPEGKRLMPVFQADIDKFGTIFQEVDRLSEAGNPTKAVQYGWQNNPPVLKEMGETADRLVAIYQEVLASNATTAESLYNRSLWIAIVLLSLAAAVGVVILLVTRRVNLDLSNIVSELGSGAEQVSAASSQIASGSQTMAQGASEQAASVEEISASMEEMSAMTKSNGANSAEAMAMMVETASQVERSNTALSEMVASMGAIKSSSERVAKINKTIDEIAFQTNILALNAAVEAARAGEAGKGFAVVADEVRNLAQRAAAAAKDTAALIEESIANSNQGSQKLGLVSEAIRGITEGAEKVKNLVSEVNESGKEQVQGIQQVTTGIQQVSTVTQSNASGAEESAAAAQELNAQSMKVQELVNNLRRMVDGGEGHVSGVPSRTKRSSALPAVRPAVKLRAPKPEETFPLEPAGNGTFRSF